MLIDWLVLGSALVAGLLGGVHCAAMCGAIATSLSFGQKAASPATQWLHALQPNLGRVLGYTVAGAIVGGVGHGLVAVAQWPELRIALRVGVGLLMIVVALRLLDPRGRLNPLSKPANALWSRLQPLQRALLPADTAFKRIGIGLLWGWLPCGLSATLLATALAAGQHDQWRADHARLRPRHPAGDAAADLERRPPRSCSACAPARRPAHRPPPALLVGAARRPAHHRRTVG